MVTTIPLGRRLNIAIGAVAWFLLIVAGALGGLVLAVAPWWDTAAIVVAAALFASPLLVVSRFFSARDIGWSPTSAFIKSFVFFCLIESAVIGLPVYYFAYVADTRPALAPLVTLTDGKRTVQLQGLQPVGSEAFYKSVAHDLSEAASQGYKLYYDNVRPIDDRPDLTTWFEAVKSAGGLDARDKALADGCGLQLQPGALQGLAKDAAADVDYAELKAEYDRLMRDDPAFAAAMSAPPKASPFGGRGAAGLFLGAWSADTPEQKRLAGLACRGFFSWVFARKTAPSERDKLIVDFRNARLAKRIAEAGDEKIYVVYGARHIPGVIEDLKALNPDWRVVSMRWAPVIANPQPRKGELG